MEVTFNVAQAGRHGALEHSTLQAICSFRSCFGEWLPWRTPSARVILSETYSSITTTKSLSSPAPSAQPVRPSRLPVKVAQRVVGSARQALRTTKSLAVCLAAIEARESSALPAGEKDPSASDRMPCCYQSFAVASARSFLAKGAHGIRSAKSTRSGVVRATQSGAQESTDTAARRSGTALERHHSC